MNLKTPDARKELAVSKNPYWIEVDLGVGLGYGKGKRGGSWFLRRHVKTEYITKRLGKADDNVKADGVAVLSFTQARKKAVAYEDQPEEIKTIRHPSLYSVSDALDDYLVWYSDEGKKAYDRTRLIIETAIVPKLGNLSVTRLTTKRINDWKTAMSKTPPMTTRGNVRPPYSVLTDTGRKNRNGNPVKEYVPIPYEEWTDEMKRRRKSTANRILTVLKAGLNHAWRTSEVSIDPNPWRKVKAFAKVDAARVRYFTADEARLFLDACSDDFRPMARAALLTGARYSELCNLRVRDLNDDHIHVSDGKTGQRNVSLSVAGLEFFRGLAASRRPHDYLLTHTDDTPWGKSHQTRPMKEACTAAGLEPMGFHCLRHTFATLLLSSKGGAGVSVRHVAALIGDSVATTSKHYGHVMQDDLKSEMDRKLPSF